MTKRVRGGEETGTDNAPSAKIRKSEAPVGKPVEPASKLPITDSETAQMELPDPSENISPDMYLKALVDAVCGFTPTFQRALEMDDYFTGVTEKQIEAYGTDVVNATRENNFEALKALHKNGSSVDCCNRFGESLLHMVCRRGFTQMGNFLLEDASLNVRITDDCGRTPFHDICWHHTPNLDLAEMVIQRDPTLLLICDKRGHTPFQYARQHHWPAW
eukprot:CAMPEP_0202458556 /NCGR_PEP_ID=MMETSP1360-20130828/26447_1 /ASSEMBLY_ACC=CAM_ASM_000848 /TAXON_ID=515479 /ORGANISM="Licmophora paradoxa, Strain CCMP2313" /LENGTH=216 /DNA_ID=CAMNT_0049079157 /DNA_START=165 /DNA_END=812 /DNA_ORIENTATION=+